MVATVSYIRENQLRQLKSSVEDNLEVYLSPETPDGQAFFEVGESESLLRSSSIPIAENLAERIRMPEDGNTMDAENSIIVYESLKDLTLQQATDERVWAYLTHFDLRNYVRVRWPQDRDPDNPERAIRNIRMHYFVSGVRGCFRDNGVSRLWWMGWIASRCQHFSVEKTLEILLYRSDVRANLLERSSFGMSAEIFNAVMKRLGESYEEEEQPLFKRSTFREFMKRLNRIGGRVALNALDPGQLDKLLGDIISDIDT